MTLFEISIEDTIQIVVWSSLVEHGPFDFIFQSHFQVDLLKCVITDEKFTQLLSKVVFNKLELIGIGRY